MNDLNYGKYYIDQAKFLDSVSVATGSYDYVQGANDTIHIALSCQVSDLVRVVLCRQCKYFKECKNSYQGFCEKHGKLMSTDDFCSRGVKAKREDE